MITVRVPATSANLGSGFDCFGLALSLYATVSFEKSDRLKIDGCPPEFENESNLVYVAYTHTLKTMGLPAEPVIITISSSIPIARGLGSSAALLVAGVLGANAMHGSPLDRQRCLSLCNELEGHPDNVSPALFGGCVASVLHENQPIAIPFIVHPSLCVLALIPDFELSTPLSRSVLPQTVVFKDAVFNGSRCAILGKAMETGNPEWLAIATQDRLHQPYRKGLIPDFDIIQSIVMKAGAYAFFISGAGPTLLCIYSDPGFVDRVKESLINTHAHWSCQTLDIDKQGATLIFK